LTFYGLLVEKDLNIYLCQKNAVEEKRRKMNLLQQEVTGFVVIDFKE
jgi:hypothetical protein